MRRAVVSTLVGLAAVLVCLSSYGMFVTQPEDTEVVEKKVTNEDGTTTTIKEYRLKSGALKLPSEESVPKIVKGTGVKHSKGWERVTGSYTPKEAPYSVFRVKPKDWPIPDSVGNAAKVPSMKEDKSGGGLHWFVSLICLGIIAYAVVRLVIHMREVPDPNRI